MGTIITGAATVAAASSDRADIVRTVDRESRLIGMGAVLATFACDLNKSRAIPVVDKLGDAGPGGRAKCNSAWRISILGPRTGRIVRLSWARRLLPVAIDGVSTLVARWSPFDGTIHTAASSAAVRRHLRFAPNAIPGEDPATSRIGIAAEPSLGSWRQPEQRRVHDRTGLHARSRQPTCRDQVDLPSRALRRRGGSVGGPGEVTVVSAFNDLMSFTA
jgi:hypothetical protein